MQKISWLTKTISCQAQRLCPGDINCLLMKNENLYIQCMLLECIHTFIHAHPHNLALTDTLSTCTDSGKTNDLILFPLSGWAGWSSAGEALIPPGDGIGVTHLGLHSHRHSGTWSSPAAGTLTHTCPRLALMGQYNPCGVMDRQASILHATYCLFSHASIFPQLFLPKSSKSTPFSTSVFFPKHPVIKVLCNLNKLFPGIP